MLLNEGVLQGAYTTKAILYPGSTSLSKIPKRFWVAPQVLSAAWPVVESYWSSDPNWELLQISLQPSLPLPLQLPSSLLTTTHWTGASHIWVTQDAWSCAANQLVQG